MTVRQHRPDSSQQASSKPGAVQTYLDIKTRANNGEAGKTELAWLARAEASGYTADKANATLSDPQAMADYANWKEGGASRVAAHAALGALGGGLAGAAGAGASAAAAPTLNDWQANLQGKLTESGISSEASQALSKLMTGGAAALLGAAATGGSTAGTLTGANADFNNRQLHQQERSLIEKLAKDKAAQTCKPSDTDCVNNQTRFWTDTLERAASGLVDDKANADNMAYLAQLAKASADPNSEGARGLLQNYAEALKTAQGMLAPYMGKTITVNGQTAIADGSPQTYFSATAAQKDDPYGNYFLGSKPDSIAPLKNLRDEERTERFGALNGAAKPDTTLEEFLLGGKIVEKGIGVVGKLFGARPAYQPPPAAPAPACVPAPRSCRSPSIR